MATKVTICNNCGGANIKVLNPELIKTATTPTVRVTAKCLDCSNDFTFNTATDSGRNKGIRY
jgi:RNase P subunit RPR2